MIPVDALTTMQGKCTLDAPSVSGQESFFSLSSRVLSVSDIQVIMGRDSDGSDIPQVTYHTIHTSNTWWQMR